MQMALRRVCGAAHLPTRTDSHTLAIKAGPSPEAVDQRVSKYDAASFELLLACRHSAGRATGVAYAHTC